MRIARYLAIAVLVAAIGCGDDDDATPAPQPTIAEIAASNPDFETLNAALVQTGLDDVLDGDGPFTVFAPTDDAFEALGAGVIGSLDDDTLADILTFHVLGELADASEVIATPQFTTVNGAPLKVAVFDSTVVLEGVVQVTQTDIEAANGIIHVIDSVLLPPDIAFPGTIVDQLSAYPIFDTLVGAVVDADLAETLSGDNGGAGFTVFAPTNFAFAGIDLSGVTLEQLTDVLLYHAVPDTVDAAAVVESDSVTTALGEDVDIAVIDGGVVLNDTVNINRTDFFASNGVVHVIDGVLLP